MLEIFLLGRISGKDLVFYMLMWCGINFLCSKRM